MKSINNYSIKTYPSLPYTGWLKPCYQCSTITSRYIIINKLNKYYMCQVCIRNKNFFKIKQKYNKEFTISYS